MKNTTKALLALSLMLPAALAFQGEAEASYGNWHTINGMGDCQVRVWTDYDAYTSSATSIDAYAESRYCSQLDYKMEVLEIPYAGAISPTYSGYFSYRTPTKYFYFRDMPTLSGRSYSTQVAVYVDIYKSGKYISSAVSNNLTIYPR